MFRLVEHRSHRWNSNEKKCTLPVMLDAMSVPMFHTIFDLVVVGGGTAGMPCALAAVEGGASVLLIDKADHLGGTLTISGGHMSAAGTALQQRHGITNDSIDQHYDDVVRISEDTARHDIARKAVELAPEMMDWLDREGFAWHPSAPRIVYGHEPYGIPRTAYGVDEGRTMLDFLASRIQARQANGEMDVWLSSPMQSLITSDAGHVTGVVVERNGTPVSVSARSVVLATGGFGANPELFAELEGVPLVSAAVETSTGDGLLAARSIGAGIAGVGTYLPTFGGMPAPDNPQRVQWVDRPHLAATERMPYEIYVDAYGKRFIAEDDESIDRKERALTNVENMTFFMVFDDHAVSVSAPMVIGWTAEKMRERANTRDGVYAADSVEELAAKAGIEAAGLADTIASYNASVAAGGGDSLGRTFLPAPIAVGPFYALRNHGITLLTFAGVDVDSDLRVRRSDGSVIEGLYGLGELLGSGAYMGNSFCSGMLVGPCISFGRWLGTELARRR